MPSIEKETLAKHAKGRRWRQLRIKNEELGIREKGVAEVFRDLDRKKKERNDLSQSTQITLIHNLL